MNWESDSDIAVGECLAKIPRQPKVKTTDYLESGAFPVIDQGTKFVGGYVNDESLLYTGPLPVVIFGDHNRHIKFVKSPFAVGADGTQLLYPDKRFDVSYFHYAIRALPLKNYGYERHFKYLKEERLRVWPLDVQRRIASILSAYDDLIENNTRRIAILEEMARRIYEEWFVRFRFPGHAGVRMVESETGLVPDGWAIETLDDCALVTMGQSPSSEFYNDAGHGLPFHQGVTNFGRHFPTHRTYCTSEGRTADEGDILVSVRAPVGRINLSPTRLIIGRGLCAVRSKAGQQTYLLHRLLETFREEDSMGNGAIFKAVSKQEVFGLEFFAPPRVLVDKFESVARPIWLLIRNLSAKNTNLRTTRDLLLPKLISGELDVSTLPDPEAVAA